MQIFTTFTLCRNKETFRVYIVLPLLPAFEGEIGTSGGYALQAVTHWNYKSISKGPNSLWNNLLQKGKGLFIADFFTVYISSLLSNVFIMSPSERGGGHNVFSADYIGVSVSVSMTLSCLYDIS